MSIKIGDFVTIDVGPSSIEPIRIEEALVCGRSINSGKFIVELPRSTDIILGWSSLESSDNIEMTHHASFRYLYIDNVLVFLVDDRPKAVRDALRKESWYKCKASEAEIGDIVCTEDLYLMYKHDGILSQLKPNSSLAYYVHDIEGGCLYLTDDSRKDHGPIVSLSDCVYKYDNRASVVRDSLREDLDNE